MAKSITTCEEYVIQELQQTKTENDSLKEQLALCKRYLDNTKNELEFLIRIIREHSDPITADTTSLSVYFSYYSYTEKPDIEKDFKRFKSYFNLKTEDKKEEK